MEIKDVNLSFRPLQKTDFIHLQKWLNKPHLNAEWGEGKIWIIHEIRHKYTTYTNQYKIVNGKW
ncbi:MAG: hypothetical protein JWM09_1536 [Francisellaceae bacterium]|nr:hypothetical protein [Francisellaceae bacterium]